MSIGLAKWSALLCAVLFTVALSVEAFAQQRGQPVNVNGSFEETEPGSVAGGAMDGWLIEVGGGASADFEVVTDPVQHGEQALKVVLNEAGTSAWHVQLIATGIPAVPGDTYRLSVWAKGENSGRELAITVGNAAFQEYGAIRPANLTDEWQEFAFQFTVTDSETVIRAPIHFNFPANVGEPIYLDNLRIVNLRDPGDDPGMTPLAEGLDKFLGNIYSMSQRPGFESYWNQVTPENAGKWGSVEQTRGSRNWSAMDAAYNLARENDMPFRFHVLVWGNQQPAWIRDLSQEEQLAAIEDWFAAVAERYSDMEYVEVVNEPIHDPPRQTQQDRDQGRTDYGNYIEALGGDGETGWDWVLTSFRMAREHFPNARLMINEYNILSSDANTTRYLEIIQLLQAEDLIDGIGVQGHAFSTRGPVTAMRNRLDRLAATGLPIQVTEMDVDGNPNGTQGLSEEVSAARQLADYQRIFPVLWEHPAVEGITLWGWRPGMWRTTQEAYLMLADGSERPAIQWIREYLEGQRVSVEDHGATHESALLLRNYPNPFVSATTIEFEVGATEYVTLRVYDATGRLVRTLVDEVKTPGQHRVTFEAQGLSSGTYFYRAEAGAYTETRPLVVVK